MATHDEKPTPVMRDLADPHRDSMTSDGATHVDPEVHEQNKKLENPLVGRSREELFHDAEKFVRQAGLDEDLIPLFQRGALVAQDPHNARHLAELSDEEKLFLEEETTHKWRQTWTLYSVTFLCSMAAVVQGMDETVINGANLFYPEQFGIGGDTTRDTLLVGMVNAAPYICSALFSCWLTYPLNRWFGRRGTIFISTGFAGITCIWSALTSSWQHLFVARIFLGIGIGPKSATTPVFSAEIAPSNIRGALVMQWQVWTAFGIMLGTVSSLIFQNVPDKPHITGLAWRLMLGSACLPAFVVCSQVYFCPESPRWLMGRKEYTKAYASLLRLRRSPIQAARDLYYTSRLIEIEEEVARQTSDNKLVELFKIPRNRRAVYASSVVMFGQQFCGVNAIAYYSSNIFKEAGASNTKALLGSFGTGILNFVFALPAFLTIDTFGRRSLLLVTFPFLSATMVLGGLGFLLTDPTKRLAVVTLGMYLFECFYSPGMGPVPFSYSAEAYPLQVRELGMALATATTWFFNAVVALTFPLLVQAFTALGAFMWFGAWNAVLFFLVLVLVPETKQLSLEELDMVFSMSSKRLAVYGLATPGYQFRKLVLRKKEHRTPLYEFNPSEEKDRPTISHKEHV